MRLVRLSSFAWKQASFGSLIVALGLVVGCETKSWLDPSEVGRYKQDKLLLPILSNLDTGVEEPNEEFLNASDPQPEDLVATAEDYVIGENDLLSVTITDLAGVGVESVYDRRVTDSGRVSLPLIGQVQAAGMTEAELEAQIAETYRAAELIPNAQITVVVREARARTFSILGSVARPDLYGILEADFRILDALVRAGDVTSPFIDYLYVIRKVEDGGDEAADEQAEPGMEEPATAPGPDILEPSSNRPTSPEHVAMMQASGEGDMVDPAPAATEPGTDEVVGDGGKYIMLDGKRVLIDGEDAATAPADGLDEPAVDDGMEGMDTTGDTSTDESDFEFGELSPLEKRVIRIPVQELKNGNLKYNIVVRPDDMILVPSPTIGEYYMGGHVRNVGPYSLTARKITLKQAVIAAGMLDGLAIPERTDIIRRIGPDKEVFARVNLAKIFDGTQPDIFLKPNDQVMVGTNAIAPFLAALRNAFRFTYGFGFLYDRNYYDQNDNNN